MKTSSPLLNLVNVDSVSSSTPNSALKLTDDSRLYTTCLTFTPLALSNTHIGAGQCASYYNRKHVDVQPDGTETYSVLLHESNQPLDAEYPDTLTANPTLNRQNGDSPMNEEPDSLCLKQNTHFQESPVTKQEMYSCNDEKPFTSSCDQHSVVHVMRKEEQYLDGNTPTILISDPSSCRSPSRKVGVEYPSTTRSRSESQSRLEKHTTSLFNDVLISVEPSTSHYLTHYPKQRRSFHERTDAFSGYYDKHTCQEAQWCNNLSWSAPKLHLNCLSSPQTTSNAFSPWSATPEYQDSAVWTAPFQSPSSGTMFSKRQQGDGIEAHENLKQLLNCLSRMATRETEASVGAATAAVLCNVHEQSLLLQKSKSDEDEQENNNNNPHLIYPPDVEQLDSNIFCHERQQNMKTHLLRDTLYPLCFNDKSSSVLTHSFINPRSVSPSPMSPTNTVNWSSLSPLPRNNYYMNGSATTPASFQDNDALLRCFMSQAAASHHDTSGSPLTTCHLGGFHQADFNLASSHDDSLLLPDVTSRVQSSSQDNVYYDFKETLTTRKSQNDASVDFPSIRYQISSPCEKSQQRKKQNFYDHSDEDSMQHLQSSDMSHKSIPSYGTSEKCNTSDSTQQSEPYAKYILMLPKTFKESAERYVQSDTKTPVAGTQKPPLLLSPPAVNAGLRFPYKLKTSLMFCKNPSARGNNGKERLAVTQDASQIAALPSDEFSGIYPANTKRSIASPVHHKEPEEEEDNDCAPDATHEQLAECVMNVTYGSADKGRMVSPECDTQYHDCTDKQDIFKFQHSDFSNIRGEEQNAIILKKRFFDTLKCTLSTYQESEQLTHYSGKLDDLDSLIQKFQHEFRSSCTQSDDSLAITGENSLQQLPQIKVYIEDRDRMVYVSWIPKKARAYTSTEKRKMELILKRKLRENLGLRGLTKVLLFPPRGVHCKLIFDCRASAVNFMSLYGGCTRSEQTERWKAEMCRSYHIAMHKKLNNTIVKIEWSQK